MIVSLTVIFKLGRTSSVYLEPFKLTLEIKKVKPWYQSSTLYYFKAYFVTWIDRYLVPRSGHQGSGLLSKCYSWHPISRKAQNSTSEAAILKLYLVARSCLWDIIPSYSKLAGTPATYFASFPWPEKCGVFSSDYPLRDLHYDHLFSEFRACLAQKPQLKSSHNPNCS